MTTNSFPGIPPEDHHIPSPRTPVPGWAAPFDPGNLHRAPVHDETTGRPSPAPDSKRPGALRLLDFREGRRMIHCLIGLSAVAAIVSIIIFKHFIPFGGPISVTAGTGRQGFTKSPEERGTINIVWSCVTTVFTCVYVLLHLDVPQVEADPKRRFSSSIRLIGRKVPWIAFNIVAPELFAYIAIVEFFCARKRRKRMVQLFPRLDIEQRWTLTHQFFADMGGFKVPVEPAQTRSTEIIVTDHATTKGANLEETGIDEETRASQRDPEKTGADEQARASHPDLEKAGASEQTRAPQPERTVVLPSGRDFLEWSKLNESAFSKINLEQVGLDIDDKSKGGFAKTLAIIQSIWVVMQTIVRAVEGRSVSALEVTTCTYVASAFFTYVFLLKKPYGVQKHILLNVPPTSEPNWQMDTNPTPFNRKTEDSTLDSHAVIFSGCIGALIGAIHCTFWNATFADANGQLVWRVCSAMQIIGSLFTSIFLSLPGARSRAYFKWDKKYDNVFLAAAFVPCFFQFCARIAILLLAGYSFRSLPADVYLVTEWTGSWLPHFH